ncbi:PAP2 superfamily protein [Gemmata obscuriglobus]|uniref:vanadium-dependent haloperoxidase n=1 Tax=Gemmata obscuriglobus TaxID=114 RepID=UPI00067FCC3A|nr:vanadium-dependent haloperoxidase [Gemmata obscuriglobus]QEG26571.1 PAP2 superfamily protein [Gemmata obscuriglobus]VTS02000.1 phosphoesterase : Uncharacterized protein OS=Sphingomonas sanxanigenens DSM 19645 = NX02 GN=NX02_16765 PE=4 SV=1: PAP2 [Gemmata obscuriglobus UQM 2246]
MAESNNGDTAREFKIGAARIRGLGSFHKTLPHNQWGEVDEDEFKKLVAATQGDGSGFAAVLGGATGAAAFTNPQAGLAFDRLTQHPSAYSMPPAPKVLSVTAAAEMTELYWMALLRDVPFDQFDTDQRAAAAATEIESRFAEAVGDTGDAGHLITGVDVPGPAGALSDITPQNLFRLGLPGEELGPLVSQFFIRDVHYGTQRIDQKQLPYKKGRDYLTEFPDWLRAQSSGRDGKGQAYPQSNEDSANNFETNRRYVSTPRDLARFVNKDALHQAYFNAALLLLSGGARWTPGNPYGDGQRLEPREAGFGVLGGPHILALVSEVATRALKVVWNQKWQVHLRLRPEAYGGLVHVQKIGIGGSNGKRPYGLPGWVGTTDAAKEVRKQHKSLLLPMAFTAGSPTHPAYGAGHATVAGACVTVLKAYFKTFTNEGGVDIPVPFKTLKEREQPYGAGDTIKCYATGIMTSPEGDEGTRNPLPDSIADTLTIEGELNKLATNVAMGRSMGGVHWRTDNTRSLMLGEALAARILADITTDANEKPTFTFRSFARKMDGEPKKVRIAHGRVYVDDVLVDTNSSAL